MNVNGVFRMGGRFVITGSQLGALWSLIEHNEVLEIVKLFNEVFNKQFIYNSNKEIRKDVKALQKLTKDINCEVWKE